jgi:enterochelin esterase-like enzyme
MSPRQVVLPSGPPVMKLTGNLSRPRTVLLLAVALAPVFAVVAFAVTVHLWTDVPVLDDPPPTPVVFSPEVAADGIVAFRLYAPRAREVMLVWRNQPQLMIMDDQGVWSVNVGPLDPETYSYQFRVDGVPTADPINPRVKLGRNTIQNLVEVPGIRPRPYDLRPVPHGTLHVLHYESKALGGAPRGLVVYTPPDYDPRYRRRYPVLYLLHGTGEDEHTWTGVGFAHRILDNLIADGKAAPMIVAMPDGHPVDRRVSDDPTANTKAMEADLIGDVIPLVDRSFRTQADQSRRALAGLSMGGGQAFAIGTAHLDTFAYVCPFSMGRGNAPDLAEQLDPAEVNRRLKLLWIGCGRQDHLYEWSERVCDVLASKGIHHVWHQCEGEHNWIVWRNSLADVAPLLFR